MQCCCSHKGLSIDTDPPELCGLVSSVLGQDDIDHHLSEAYSIADYKQESDYVHSMCCAWEGQTISVRLHAGGQTVGINGHSQWNIHDIIPRQGSVR